MWIKDSFSINKKKEVIDIDLKTISNILVKKRNKSNLSFWEFNYLDNNKIIIEEINEDNTNYLIAKKWNKEISRIINEISY